MRLAYRPSASSWAAASGQRDSLISESTKPAPPSAAITSQPTYPPEELDHRLREGVRVFEVEVSIVRGGERLCRMRTRAVPLVEWQCEMLQRGDRAFVEITTSGSRNQTAIDSMLDCAA